MPRLASAVASQQAAVQQAEAAQQAAQEQLEKYLHEIQLAEEGASQV